MWDLCFPEGYVSPHQHQHCRCVGGGGEGWMAWRFLSRAPDGLKLFQVDLAGEGGMRS